MNREKERGASTRPVAEKIDIAAGERQTKLESEDVRELVDLFRSLNRWYEERDL